MIEPGVRRSFQDKESLDELKKDQDLLRKKIDECEFIIQKA